MTNRVYDKNGFFKSEGNPIARSGILEYAGASISPELEPDRIYKVWRPESELNNPETIESFKLVPWFSRHEMTGDNFTPAEQIGVQGVTGEEIYFDESDKTLKSTIKAFGSSLRKMIDQGIKDLSIGMTCDWIIKGGVTPNGEPYDVMQTNIRGNHLASVYEGRAGKGVAVMDSSEVLKFAMDELDFKHENEDSKMSFEELMKAVKALSGEDMAKLKTSLSGGEAKDKEDKKEGEAKDKEESKKDDAKDKDDDKKPSAMDAAAVEQIVSRATKPLLDKISKLEGSAMDQTSIVKAINAKNVLASQVAKHVGAFDHAEMASEQEVAQYGVKKLGIACDSGAELSTLKGWLAAKAPVKIIVDSGAQDGADNKPKTLEEMGLA